MVLVFVKEKTHDDGGDGGHRGAFPYPNHDDNDDDDDDLPRRCCRMICLIFSIGRIIRTTTIIGGASRKRGSIFDI